MIVGFPTEISIYKPCTDIVVSNSCVVISCVTFYMKMASSERWLQFIMGLKTVLLLLFLSRLTFVDSVSKASMTTSYKHNSPEPQTQYNENLTTTARTSAAVSAVNETAFNSSNSNVHPANAGSTPSMSSSPIIKPISDNNDKKVNTSHPQSTPSANSSQLERTIASPIVTPAVMMNATVSITTAAAVTVPTTTTTTTTTSRPVVKPSVSVDSLQNSLDGESDVIPPPNDDHFPMVDSIGEDDQTSEPIEDDDNADISYDSKSTKLTDNMGNSAKGPHHTTSYGEPDDGDTHFFVYYLTVIGVCILMYVLFHNKQKILALIVEGRQERRRRPNTSQYRPLDNNLEEVIQGGIPKNSRATNIIY